MSRHALGVTIAAIGLSLAACASGGGSGPSCSCPSALQTCDPASGTCSCPAPCASGALACAADGTRVTCGYDVAGGCLAFPAGGGAPCAGVQVCSDAGAGATCACPAAGDRAGQGCAAAGARACDGGAAAVDVCAVDTASGCLAWSVETPCAAGLVCGTASTGGGTLACECPRHAADDGAFWADAAAGGTAPAPSGVASPPGCRLATLRAALAAASASTAADAHRAVASGVAPPPGWKPWTEGTPYRAGDVVLPRRANGHSYRAQTVAGGGTGSSAQAEPAWPLASGANVVDGAVTWQEQGVVPGMVFAEAPLTVPTRVLLTTEACEAGACEPRLYLLPYDATTALDVAGAAEGFTVSKTGSADAAPGSAAVRVKGGFRHASVWADGGAARTPVGIAASPAGLEDVVVSGAGETGVTVTGTADFGTFVRYVTVIGSGGDGIAASNGSLVCADSSIHDNGGAGVRATGSGSLQVDRTAVYGNGGPGIVARSSWGTSLGGNDVHGNGDTGMIVQRSGQDSVSVGSNRVYGNGASASVGGIHLVGTSSPGVLGFGRNRVYGNRAHQVLVEEEAEPFIPAAWTLDGIDVDGGTTAANTFACYDASGPWVGVAAAGWAQVSARANSWAAALPAEGADWAACPACSVDASGPLAPLLDVTCP